MCCEYRFEKLGSGSSNGESFVVDFTVNSACGCGCKNFSYYHYLITLFPCCKIQVFFFIYFRSKNNSILSQKCPWQTVDFNFIKQFQYYVIMFQTCFIDFRCVSHLIPPILWWAVNSPVSHLACHQRPARERHKICIASRENVDNQTPRNTNFTH